MCAMMYMAYYRDHVLCSLLVPCVFGSNAYQGCSLELFGFSAVKQNWHSNLLTCWM